MRPFGKVAAGLLVIAVGLVFLAANLGWFEVEVWGILGRFWPVLLIGAGVVVLTGGRLGTAIVLVLAAVVVLWLFVGPRSGEIALQHTEISSTGEEPEVSVLRADIDLTAAQVSTAGPGGRLFYVGIDHRPGGLTHSYEATAGTGNLRVNASIGIPINIHTGRTPRAILEFREDVALDLDLSLTAGQADLDLRRYNVERLDVRGGAGQIKVRFGEPQGQVTARASVTTGEVEVWVPRDAALRVSGGVSIGEREFSVAGLSRVNGYWQDESYGTAMSRIDLELQATIGRVSLKRY